MRKNIYKYGIENLCSTAVKSGALLMLGASLATSLSSPAQEVKDEFAPDPTPSWSAGDDGLGTLDSLESSDPGPSWSVSGDDNSYDLSPSSTDNSDFDGGGVPETDDETPSWTITIEGPASDSYPDSGFQDPWTSSGPDFGNDGVWTTPEPDYPSVPEIVDPIEPMDDPTLVPEPVDPPVDSEITQGLQQEYGKYVIEGINNTSKPESAPSGSNSSQAAPE